jgi:single-strand DNA-binding protein
MALPEVTLIGNLTQDPELRFTTNGLSVTTLRVACSERKRDAAGNWGDGDTLYINASIWGEAGQEITQKLIKGNSVIVTGKLRSRDYTNDAGEKKTIFEILAKNVAQLIKANKAPVQNNQYQKPVEQDPWNAPF